jgi:hypothetical protein
VAGSSVSFISHGGEEFGTDIILFGGRKLILPIHVSDNAHISWFGTSSIPYTHSLDGIMGIAKHGPLSAFWDTFSLRCSGLILGGHEHNHGHQCIRPTSGHMPTNGLALPNVPICTNIVGTSACFAACFSDSWAATRSARSDIIDALTFGDLIVSVHGTNLVPNTTCTCTIPSAPQFLLRSTNDAPHVVHAAPELAGLPCEVYFGLSDWDNIAIVNDIAADEIALIQCADCRHSQTVAAISALFFVLLAFPWFTMIVPWRIHRKGVCQLATLLQWVAHFGAVCVFLSAAIGRHNGQNLAMFANVRPIWGDLFVGTVVALGAILNFILFRLNMQRAIHMSSYVDGPLWKHMTNAFEENRLYHRFLFEIVIMVIVWYIIMEIPDYPLKALLTAFLITVLLCDILYLSFSAVLGKTLQWHYITIATILLSAGITVFTILPILENFFPCQIALSIVVIIYYLFLVIGPALSLCALGRLYELKNN